MLEIDLGGPSLYFILLVLLQEKLRTIQDEHRVQVERLENKLATTEAQLQRQLRDLAAADSTPPGAHSPLRLNLHQETPLRSTEERQSGEVRGLLLYLNLGGGLSFLNVLTLKCCGCC